MEILLFYTPVADSAEAEVLGRKAVASKLAACANHFPIQSSYFWKGEIQSEGEVVLLLKTTSNKKEALRNFLEEHHRYEVPAIISWPAEVNESYGNWMIEVTS